MLKIIRTLISWDKSHVPTVAAFWALRLLAVPRKGKQAAETTLQIQNVTCTYSFNKATKGPGWPLSFWFCFVFSFPKNLESNCIFYHTFGDLNSIQTSVRCVFLITSDFHFQVLCIKTLKLPCSL